MNPSGKGRRKRRGSGGGEEGKDEWGERRGRGRSGGGTTGREKGVLEGGGGGGREGGREGEEEREREGEGLGEGIGEGKRSYTWKVKGRMGGKDRIIVGHRNEKGETGRERAGVTQNCLGYECVLPGLGRGRFWGRASVAKVEIDEV